MVDDAFGNWLAGFFDGEGTFGIYPRQNRKALVFIASIHLRLDDLPILNQIRDRTGIGKVFVGSQQASRPNERPSAMWQVQDKGGCVILCQIFDRYPLRAKKARDYAIWREAVKLRDPIKARRSADWSSLQALRDELIRIRKFAPTGEPSEPVDLRLVEEA